METKVVDGRFLEGKHGHELFEISQKLILKDASTDRFLLLKIANEEKNSFAKRYGAWDFPGGRVDVREDLNGSLFREAAEEIGGINSSGPSVVDLFLAEYSDNFERRVCIVGYLAVVQESSELKLSDEHSEFRWVTTEEVEQGAEYGEMVQRFIARASERLKEREYLNDVKRISADFENYRRRQEERMKELSAMSAERFAMDIIPVIDNFRMAAQHVPEAEKENAWMTGITYIGKQLEEALATNGISAFEAKEGDVFDPHRHEAVSQEEGKEEGTVVKVLQPGYISGTRVIRPAKVIVS